MQRCVRPFAQLIALMLVVVLLAACLPVRTPQQPEIVVSLYASPEKKRVLDDLLTRYAATRPTVDGQPVIVRVSYMESGEILDAVRDGQQPTAISPASSTWLTQLSAEWRADYPDTPDVVSAPRQLWVSPIVIGMWEPMAKALGGSERAISWRSIISATLDSRGWSAYGHAEWGAFKFAHAGPDTDSGRLALLAIFYAGAGKVRDLTISDLNDQRVLTYVQNIQRGIAQYGESDTAIAAQMKQNGLTFVSATVMEEATLIAFNTQPPRPTEKLVALYPVEGTFWADHPYTTLNAPWVTAAQATASRNLLTYLLNTDSQRTALAAGFRPSNLSISLDNSPVSAANGVDPKQPVTLLAVPDTQVLDSVRNTWALTKKPANIILVADVSGSMDEDNKIVNARSGMLDFVSSITLNDKVGLIVFDDVVRTRVPLAGLAPEQRNLILSQINNLTPGGKTALYRATREAVEQLVRLNDRESINAVVLMTDGQDTLNERNAKAGLLSYLKTVATNGQRGRGPIIKVFTVAYGSSAERDTLKEIASATGGVSVEGTTATIRKLYRLLSSYF